MKLSKKRKQEINRTSVFDDLLWKHQEATNDAPEPWWLLPPDTWSENETALFDLVCGIEDKMKEEILKVIEQ